MYHRLLSYYHHIDKYLLLNRPELWETQIHKLVFGLSFYILGLIVLAFFMPAFTNNSLDTFLFMPAILIFLYWLNQITVYKMEGQRGWLNQEMRQKQLGAYLLGLSLIVSSIYVVNIPLHFRKAYYTSTNELVKDLNDLNLGFIYFLKGDSEYVNKLLALYKSNQLADESSDLGGLPFWSFMPNLDREKEATLYTQTYIKKQLSLAKDSAAYREVIIANYIKAYNRYAEKPIKQIPPIIDRLFMHRLANANFNIVNNSEYYVDFERLKVMQKVHAIIYAKTKPYVFQESQTYATVWLIVSIMTLFLLLFLELGGLDFVLFLFLGTFLYIVNYFVVNITRMPHNYSALLFFGQFLLFLALYVFWDRSKLGLFFKRMCLSLLSVSVLAFPMVWCAYSDVYLNRNVLTITWILGSILALFAWVKIFQKQFLKTNSYPKTN